MKVLTLNTWTEKGPWRERWKVILNALKDLQPDVFVFQEVFNPNWVRELREETGFSFLVYPPISEVSGLGILSRFPVLELGSFKLKAQSRQKEPRRFLLFAEFENGNSKFSVYNTHLTWRLDEGPVRCRQTEEILGFIGRRGGVPEILCGDFNSSCETPELKKVAAAGFEDTYQTLNPDKNKLTWDNANPYAASASVRLPDRRIDFIFCRGVKPKASKIVLKTPNENGVFASDHYGVLTEF